MMAAISLTDGIPLSELLNDFVSELPPGDLLVTGVAIDSRQVQPGDLFIAYRQGANFIKDAVNAGASAVVAENFDLSGYEKREIPVFNVSGLNSKTGKIISRFYDNPSSKINMIGVTGTNGKTSVSYLLAQALSTGENKCGLFGTLGYGTLNNLKEAITTTPDPVTLQRLFYDMAKDNLRYVVMEVSSHGLDQGRVVGVDFDMGIFTNLTHDHLDYHGDIKNYANSKQKFFTEYPLKKAVINLDDELGKSIVNILDRNIEAVGYVLVDDLNVLPQTSIPLVAGKIDSNHENSLKIYLRTPWGNGSLESNLTGSFNAYNLLACVGALCLLDISFDEVIKRLSLVKPVPGRMECFGGGSKPVVVVDYAHTPDAIKQALYALKLRCKGKLYCVFGCGGDRDKQKRPLMGSVTEQFADVIYLTNDNPRSEDPDKIIQDILNGIEDVNSVNIEVDRKVAIKHAINSATVDDIILIAGKGHETYQEIKSVKHKFSDQEVVSGILGQAE